MNIKYYKHLQHFVAYINNFLVTEEDILVNFDIQSLFIRVFIANSIDITKNLFSRNEIHYVFVDELLGIHLFTKHLL